MRHVLPRLIVAVVLIAGAAACARRGTFVIVERTSEGQPVFVEESSARSGVVYVGVPYGGPRDGGPSVSLHSGGHLPDAGGPTVSNIVSLVCIPEGECNPPGPHTGDPAALRVTVLPGQEQSVNVNVGLNH
jgi:hypothetical protein